MVGRKPTDPNAPKCPACGTRVQGPYPGGMCRKCYDIKRKAAPTVANFKELTEKVKSAEESGDWRKLAEDLRPTMLAIAAGTIEATAAQTSVIKHIMDRAYGRVTKSQEEKQGPIGVIVLPTMGEDTAAHICPQCLEAHKYHNA